jgi:hypothetical protein
LSLILSNTPVNFPVSYPEQQVNATINEGWPLNIEILGNVQPINITQNASDMIGLTNPSYQIGIGNVTWNTTSSGSFTQLSSSHLIINDTCESGQTVSVYYSLYVPQILSQDYGGNLWIKGEQV